MGNCSVKAAKSHMNHKTNNVRTLNKEDKKYKELNLKYNEETTLNINDDSVW